MADATPQESYDFYGDMLETHNEIGYLLVLLVALTALMTAFLFVLWCWPDEDVYLVPGTTVYGEAAVGWSQDPPAQRAPVAAPAQPPLVINLGAATAAPPASPAAAPAAATPPAPPVPAPPPARAPATATP